MFIPVLMSIYWYRFLAGGMCSKYRGDVYVGINGIYGTYSHISLTFFLDDDDSIGL